MPRQSTSARAGFVNLVALRRYVAGRVRTDGNQILNDAFRHCLTGALELVRLVLGIRWNPRTRRSVDDAHREFTRQASQRAHWLHRLSTSLITHWRALRRDARPSSRETTTQTGPLALAPRRLQRLLRPTGLTGPPPRSLAERAKVASRTMWDFIHQQQCVLWLDNWCMLRWGTDPTNPEYTQNVTALAVLNLDTLLERPITTRSTTVPHYPGHPDLAYLIRHVEGAAALCTSSALRLHGRVDAINQLDPVASDIRVPLDVRRNAVRSLRWRPLSLTEQTVSANLDLLGILESVRDLQRRTTRQLPLLVDENIHYRVLRLMYSTTFAAYDMRRYLADVPLVYGIWHAYKHTLLVVFRAYLPVLVHLEGLRGMQGNSSGRSNRKVLYMEKLFASLLLSRAHVGSQVRARVAALARTPGALRDSAYSVQILVGLHDLLFFYVPALLQLGFKVRECTWNGRPEGHVKGDTARSVLEHALLIQVHLLRDWSAGTEYVRTMSCALLCWQPWYSRLPGCVFVEESCEAMLSRMAAQCRRHPNITTFEGTLWMFLTLPLPSDEPRDSRGSVRHDLVIEMTRRVRSLLGNPDGRLFPLPRDSSNFTWTDCTYTSWLAAGPVPRRPSQEAYAGVMRASMRSLVANRSVGPDIHDWLRRHLASTAAEDVDDHSHSIARMQRWQLPVRTIPLSANLRGGTPTQSEAAVATAAVSSTSVVTTEGPDDSAEGSDVEYEPPESLYEPSDYESSDSFVSPAFTDWVSADDDDVESPSVACEEEGST